jgi:hypothetical protein
MNSVRCMYAYIGPTHVSAPHTSVIRNIEARTKHRRSHLFHLKKISNDPQARPTPKPKASVLESLFIGGVILSRCDRCGERLFALVFTCAESIGVLEWGMLMRARIVGWCGWGNANRGKDLRRDLNAMGLSTVGSWEEWLGKGGLGTGMWFWRRQQSV